jgi:phenylalanine-4-hydroxylase
MIYTTAEHRTWSRLYERMMPRWEAGAVPVFLDGIRKLGLAADHVPALVEVNERLRPLTGFQAVEVKGYIAAPEFFAYLKRRQFPTVTAVRREDQMDYLPEPDLFHDVAGHVPMHTHPVFADTLSALGALGEAKVCDALARFFWFTIEFGLMETPRGLRAYGSGLLSSFGELEYALHSPSVERRKFDLREVLATPFEIDHFQNRLFVIGGFEELYAAVRQLPVELAALRLRQEEHNGRAQQEVAGVQNEREIESALVGGGTHG